jgi:hydrogenase maturation protein HypF
MEARHILVTGVVQGVGFRPFVYGLAARLDLRGWVANTSAGVEIRVNGEPDSLEAFVTALPAEAPALARIEGLQVEPCEPADFPGFEIRASETIEGAFQPIPPDVALCQDCERELFDPNDRRYLYAFTNCTNCGPRFTIIRDRTCRTTGLKPPWTGSSSAPSARPNTGTRPTGVSTPSPRPAPAADRACG